MKQKLTSLLFLGLAIHLFISAVFIIRPRLLAGSRLSEIYNVYLLPGPFFREDRIIDSYRMALSWKVKDQWSVPVSPAKDYFIRYNKHFNPTDNYQSRFERSLYQGLFFKRNLSREEMKKDTDFQMLTRYLAERYVPADADSFRIVLSTKKARNFSSNLDTLTIMYNK